MERHHESRGSCVVITGLLLRPLASVAGVVATLMMSSLVAAAAEDVRARERVDLGWQDGFASDMGWRCERWRIADPDEKAASRFGADGGVFDVPTPGRAMAWTRTTNPIWVAAFPYFEADYEITGSAGDDKATLVRLGDGSTGPITPGALNPENPLASGAQANLGSSMPGHHHWVVDLRTVFRSDRIAEVTLIVRASQVPAKLSIRRLAFWASDPRQAPRAATRPTSQPFLPATGGGARGAPAGDWQPITLPTKTAIPAEWLGRAFTSSITWPANRRYEQAGVPFELGDAGHTALATGVAETDSIPVAGDWKGCELALLLASRTFRNDHAIASPHELVVRLEYADGTRRSHFPWAVARQRFAVERRPEPYVIPLDTQKRLVRFAIIDKMDYGQVFLLAAAVNRSSHPVYPSLAGKPAVIEPLVRPQPAPEPVQMVCKDDILTVRSAFVEFTASLRAGLNITSLRLVPLDRTVTGDAPAPLLALVTDAGRALSLRLRDAQPSRDASGARCRILWSADDDSGRHSVRLDVDVRNDGDIYLAPTLINEDAVPWIATVVCPQLAGCRIAASMGDAWYLLGTRSTVLDHRPVSLSQSYSDTFPLQLMDLFDARQGGGIGIFVADENVNRKTFTFRQTTERTDLAVRFPNITVPAGGRVSLPTTVVFAHTGDWHDAFARYRRWVRATVTGHRRAGLADVFYCRRDYPLGGTDYLFDVRRKRYTPEELIAESARGFGGIDMIDISGWAYNEAVGRVGQYRTNDLGGLEELRRAVAVAHERGVKVGLYFEGYLLDRRSIMGKDAMPAWQLIGKDGKPMWWSGSDKEFFVCPGVAQWREQLAKVIADVAHETAADAVYVDEFGLADASKECWSRQHGHAVPSNPLTEERAVLQTIRRALNEWTPNVGIYIEFVPVDAEMGLVQAAFDYGMTMPVGPQHDTKLPLHRFIFPEVAFVQMVGHGIRPPPVTADDLHRCVFHGVAMWLKGRCDSWWTPEFREVARRAYPIFREHADAFGSPDCEPLVPTLRGDVYANRFTTAKETVITVYNAGYSDVSGDLLRVKLPQGFEAYDLWNAKPAEITRVGEEAIIRGLIEPRSVGVFLLHPTVTPAR